MILLKQVIKYFKRIILGAFILYGYNVIASNFNMVVPINLITVGMIGILGAPALVALILLKIMIM